MKKTSLLLLLVFSFCLTSTTFAQKMINSIAERGEFRIGLTGNQPPYNMKDRNDNLMGYELDLAETLANGMGVKLEVVEMPFAELLPSLESGKIDAIMSGMTVTAERSTKVLFAGPYAVSGKSMLAKTAMLTKIKVSQDSDYEDFTITCLKGSTSETFARVNMPKATIKPVDNYDEGIEMVLNGQVDAMVADYPICAITVMRNQDKDLATLENPLNIEPIGMALPAGDIHFYNLIENYLEALKLAGAIKLLENKWLNDGSWLVNLK